MCGIAGILSLNHIDDLPDRVKAMQKALKHRGTDDEGFYISPCHTIGLVHTRLAILDLTNAGHQPMVSHNDRYWITFDGEIYNFRELRQELLQEGERFVSSTDTEVILKLYERYGFSCTDRLRGMYAFAVWDTQKQECFLVRDPFGIKPLYYWRSGNTLIFASELRAILASGLTGKNVSPQGLLGYLLTGSVPEPYTMIEGINCLPGGHWISWQEGSLKQEKYWQIQFNPQSSLSRQDATQMTRQALLDSVKHHMVSDVPVGVFLSGGIDSSSIVSLGREVHSGILKTYSIVFEEDEWNEGDIAKQISDHYDTNHTEYKLTATIGLSLLSRFLDSVDQPSIDGFNTFCVSKLAGESGTKVVLSGTGGDEMFGGYSSFKRIPQLVYLGQWLNYLYPIKRTLGWGLSTWAYSPKLRRIGDFLTKESNAFDAYTSFRGIFSLQESCKILKNWFPDLLDYTLPFTNDYLHTNYTLTDQVSFLELTRYMRNQLLRDSDVMSMHWGLELRTPLVDRSLFETISLIAASDRLQIGKSLLINAVNNLPEWLINRPQKGFVLPYAKWLKNEWSDIFKDVLPISNLNLNSWYRTWSLMNLSNFLTKIK